MAVRVELWFLPKDRVVAANVPELAPAATFTELGTERRVLVSDSVTTAPADGATAVSVTVQVIEEFGPIVVGWHASEDTRIAATRLKVTLAELPLYVPVTVALELLLNVPVLAVKVAEDWPAATVTDAGTLNTELLSDKATTAPPLGAAALKVTVQVLELLDPKLVGLQAMCETDTEGGTKLTLAVPELPLYEAVSVAVAALEIVAAVALKVVLVAPAATSAEAGTVREPLLLATAIVAPPLGAAWESDTVQVDDAPEVRELGVHTSPETVALEATVMVPPVPVILAFVPSLTAPNTPLIAMESSVAVLLADRVAVTTATTPLPIGVEFAPEARQVSAPGVELQLRVFPAELRAVPPTELSEVTAAVG